jgi:hypothetical protein
VYAGVIKRDGYKQKTLLKNRNFKGEEYSKTVFGFNLERSDVPQILSSYFRKYNDKF